MDHWHHDPHDDPREQQGWEQMAGEAADVDPLAPGEHRFEIHETQFPDGRVLRSGLERISGADPRTRYPHFLRVRDVRGDCNCVIHDSDDMAQCMLPGCGRVCCLHHNHAATCGFCARVACHLHFGRVRVHTGQVVNICSECLDALTTSKFRKVLRWLLHWARRITIAVWHSWRNRRLRYASSQLPQRRP